MVHELGTMFNDTGVPLQRLLDSGSTFVSEASEHTAETIRLLDTGKRCSPPSRARARTSGCWPRDLRGLTDALAESDGDLEQTLDDTPGTARELDALLDDLEPTLPVLLGNAVSVNQVVVTHLAGIEQLLVTFPVTIAAGFTGTPGDGYGHVNLQLDYSVPPCTEGYKPRNDWRPPSDLTRRPDLPGRVHQRTAVRHARAEVLARIGLLARARVPLVVRPADRTRRRSRRCERSTPYASSTRATCRSSAATRGSGSWWVR